VCIHYLHSQNIPSGRITDWSNPGSAFSFIAQKTVVFTSFGADKSGVNTSDSAMLLAINALDGPGEIFVPKGKYLFDQTIVLPDSIIIRGEMDSLSDGPEFRFKLAPGNNQNGIEIKGTETNINYTITYPLSQGANKLFVTQPDLFSKDDYIRLVPQDDSLLVNDTWAYHTTGQIFQILDINGDSLLLNKPLRRSYNSPTLPRIYKLIPRKQVHLHCIKIERIDTSVFQASNIYFFNAADCSINGVESQFDNYAHVDIVNSIRITIKNSFFHDAFDYGSGGKGYGVMLESTAGDCFIGQNIFRHLRHSMILQSGANGNVLAYNYSIDPFWTETSLPSNSAGDIVLHGNYPYMNLMEGNVVQNIVIDNSHRINGPYNTFFRNRAELYGIFMNTSPTSNGQTFIGNQVTNTSSIFLGFYSLQGSNHFEYGNMVKGTVLPAGTGEPVYATLFNYPFKSFYTTIASIPPIRNNNWQSQNPLIEAAYRYEMNDKNAVCEDIVYLPTSIMDEDEKKATGFEIFPNPFSDEFIIKNKEANKEYLLTIYDLSGRVVFTGKLNGKTEYINTKRWAAGIYFLLINREKNGTIQMLKL
jgi:hypothetical protein